MLLAVVGRDRPDELRADFQQYYGLNIDGMGADYSPAHAAALLAQLPLESRIMRAENADLEWDEATYFLAQIEYDLRVLIWQKTKDAQHGRNKPELPKLPRDIRREQERTRNFDRALIDKVLGKVGAEYD